MDAREILLKRRRYRNTQLHGSPIEINTCKYNGQVAIVDWFARSILAWWDGHGRKDLPWQKNQTGYRVWIAEIMLQQTQVSTVIPYYKRFLARFPSLKALANATVDDVMSMWSGLGYYRRVRNLHSAARIIQDKHRGRVPRNFDQLVALPGIGRSTAGAILAQAFQKKGVILDANVRRVLQRFHHLDNTRKNAQSESAIWALASSHTPVDRIREYTQAIMDLGATICRSRIPQCGMCPVAEKCKTRLTSRFRLELKTAPRIKKRSIRINVLLVINSRGECLLEKRPDSGIWPALWSPPEIPNGVDEIGYAKSIGISESSVTKIEATRILRHSLSHLEVEFVPYVLHLKHGIDEIMDDEFFRWHRLRETADFGISAAAIKLLESISM